MGQSRGRAGVNQPRSSGRTGHRPGDHGASRPGRGHQGRLSAVLARHKTWTSVGAAMLIVMSVAAGCAATPSGQPSTALPAVPTLQPSGASTYLAPASVSAHASAILKAALGHYVKVFTQGKAIVGTTQYPNAAARLTALQNPKSVASRFVAWRKSSGIQQDLATYTDAFRQADAGFNAADEPVSISNWLRDAGTLQSDIGQWINVVVSYQKSAASRKALRAATATVKADIITAQHDVGQVRRGK
jgi:hypothetical protein